MQEKLLLPKELQSKKGEVGEAGGEAGMAATAAAVFLNLTFFERTRLSWHGQLPAPDLLLLEYLLAKPNFTSDLTVAALPLYGLP